MQNFLSTLAIIAPLMLILMIANLAERNRGREQNSDGWRILAYLLSAGVMGLVLLAGAATLLFTQVAAAQPSALGETMGVSPLAMAANPGLLGWGMVAAGIVGLILLLPAVRRLLARALPIDAESTVHAVALSFTMLVVVNMLSTVGIGLEQVSEMLTESQAAGEEILTTAAIWAQQLLFAALGFVGVGWPVRRGIGATLERLGLVVPTVRQVLLGVGLAPVLVAMVMLAQAVAALMGGGFNADVENLSEQLLGGIVSTPWGVLTLGLAAAVGEETLMRGAAQPRFGLLLTAFLFALLHSQYGITFSTWAVFGVGLVLGYIRQRHNTTTSMVTHATYNILLGLMAYLSIDLLERLR